MNKIYYVLSYRSGNAFIAAFQLIAWVAIMAPVMLTLFISVTFLLSFPVGILDNVAQAHPATWGVLIGMCCLVALVALMGLLPKRKTYFELRQQFEKR